ncbi:Gfo/Idh/MocA family oxidoreductase [Arthrobacter sp. OAP107]|uniref:Gfo/Idh/MocA family protein n=1 Tax=Arthrobacter sp. OAP107 TaxID=3156445 RepID=UPI003399272F
MTSTTAEPGKLRIALIGYSFMGSIHAQAWTAAPRFFDLGVVPVLAAVCGRDKEAARSFADKFGIGRVETDWRTLVNDPDIDAVDICVPGNLHAEIAIAALQAGKHVLCEKPLANTLAEAEKMTLAAEEAKTHGALAMVGFSYRQTPALAYARELTETFVKTRPLAGASSGLQAQPGLEGHGGTKGGLGTVTVGDAAVVIGRTVEGALATFEATRFATGRKNAVRLEVNGSLGSVAFDFEELNELWFHDHTDPAESAGFRRILVTEPNHPYTGAWWPPGHGLGYDHVFVHQAADFARCIARGEQPEPSFAEGLQIQRLLDAAETSAANNAQWQDVTAGA